MMLTTEPLDETRSGQNNRQIRTAAWNLSEPVHPDVVVEIEELPGLGGSCAVDEDVDPSEPAHGGFTQCLARLHRPKVAGDDRHLDPGFGADVFGGVFQVFGGTRGQHDVHALRGELFGDRPTDALAASGDHSDLAVESSHVASSLTPLRCRS